MSIKLMHLSREVGRFCIEESARRDRVNSNAIPA